MDQGGGEFAADFGNSLERVEEGRAVFQSSGEVGWGGFAVVDAVALAQTDATTIVAATRRIVAFVKDAVEVVTLEEIGIVLRNVEFFHKDGNRLEAAVRLVSFVEGVGEEGRETFLLFDFGFGVRSIVLGGDV